MGYASRNARPTVVTPWSRERRILLGMESILVSVGGLDGLFPVGRSDGVELRYC